MYVPSCVSTGTLAWFCCFGFLSAILAIYNFSIYFFALQNLNLWCFLVINSSFTFTHSLVHFLLRGLTDNTFIMQLISIFNCSGFLWHLVTVYTITAGAFDPWVYLHYHIFLPGLGACYTSFMVYFYSLLCFSCSFWCFKKKKILWRDKSQRSLACLTLCC